MDLIACITESWSWTGLRPISVVSTNRFGNLIVEAGDGRFWRICPEELEAKVIAANRSELLLVTHNPDFAQDWLMESLVTLATNHLGEPAPEKVFHLVFPSVLGGEYAIENIRCISLAELIGVSGNLAQQIQFMPNGALIELVIED